MRAQKAVFFAQKNAASLGAKQMEPEHLLRGLLEVRECEAVQVLRHFRLDPKDLRFSLEKNIAVSGEPILNPDDVDLGSRVRQVFSLAVAAANWRGHRYVGTMHLLLGIRLLDGPASTRLDLWQVGVDVLQEEVTRRGLQSGPPPPVEP